MENQALFSLKDKSKKLKCCLLQFLFGTLRINYDIPVITTSIPKWPSHKGKNWLLGKIAVPHSAVGRALDS